MTGIQHVTDEKGRKVAVQIDLTEHGELWEDIQDVLVSRSRRHEKRIERGKRIARPSQENDRACHCPPRKAHGSSSTPGCKKLEGGDREWRIRVGDYRIVYHR